MTIEMKQKEIDSNSELLKLKKEMESFKDESFKLSKEIAEAKLELSKLEKEKLEKYAKDEIKRIATLKSTVERRKAQERLRIKDREKVKGIFRYYEIPGGALAFNFKVYKGDPIEYYSFNDGEIYTIPFGVAKHLNKNGWYPIHRYEKDETGKSTTRIGQKVRRFGFQGLDFIDPEEFSFVYHQN